MLRFAACHYEVMPVPLPDAPSDRCADALGPPVLADGPALAQGTERCLKYVDSKAVDLGTMVVRENMPESDRAGLEALLSLVLGKLEAVATFIEFVSCPARAEAPERVLTPFSMRWLVRRQRSAKAAALIEAAGITREEDAKAAAIETYTALGTMLADALEDVRDDEPEGPFFFGEQPSILDAAVFEHLMRVQNSPADAWLKESGYAKLLESHRQVVLTRYFGGVGISKPQDALVMLGPHWAPVAGALTGTDKHDESGLNYIAIGLAAVIIGAAGYFAVSTAARGGEMQVASAADK